MFDEEFNVSEDSVVMNCDPCQFEGTQKNARAFCQECNEFLCQQCLQSHRKFQAFRHHNILCGDSMPRIREETKTRLALKFCDDHRMNEVQFYCSTHKSVLCTLCKLAKHSTCDCKLIEDICGKDDLAKFYNVAKETDAIKTEFEHLRSLQIEVIDSTTANSKSQRAQLDSVSKEINEYFEKLENELKEQEVQEKLYLEESKENVAMYTGVVNHIASLKEDIDDVSKSNDKVAIFAAKSKLKKIHGEYTILKNTIPLKTKTEKTQEVSQKILTVKEICENIKQKMTTKTSEEANEEKAKNEKVEELGKSEINMNETDDNRRERSSDNSKDTSTNENVKETNLDKQSEKAGSTFQDSPKETLNHSRDTNTSDISEARKQVKLFEKLKITSMFYKSINFEFSDSACDITGSLFLPDGSLILCDHANSNVILLDRQFELLQTLHFKGNPWDVALVNTNEIIVTLTSQKSLTYIKVESGKLHEGMSIHLRRVPWGIAVYKDNILTTFHNNPGKGFIEVRNKHGKILRNIAVDKHGEELFASPYYVTVNQNNGDVYVTDSRKQSITCLTFEGKPLHRMESDEFKWPRKVILDDQGDCLLCASLANKLLLVKNKSKYPLQSKEERDDLRVWLKKCKRPQTLSIRWDDQTMIIGLNAKNMMLVLK